MMKLEEQGCPWALLHLHLQTEGCKSALREGTVPQETWPAACVSLRAQPQLLQSLEWSVPLGRWLPEPYCIVFNIQYCRAVFNSEMLMAGQVQCWEL